MTMANPPKEVLIDVIKALQEEVSDEERAAGAANLPARRGLAAAKKRLDKLDLTGVITPPESKTD